MATSDSATFNHTNAAVFVDALGRFVDGPTPSLADGYALIRCADDDLPRLLEAAGALRDRGKGRTVTYSRKVFLPITNLCRDRCSYCTFRRDPDDPGAWTMSRAEIAEVLSRARQQGCKEALMCLGDKPEAAFASHRRTLSELGHDSTVSYVREACEMALDAGLLPHTNAGVLSSDEMQALRPVNVSLGLMLENVSPRLRARGMVHHHAPDKEPARRLAMIAEAGRLRIPFTTGILLGIGETPEERVDSLFAIADLQRAYGHVQEVIIQNFRAKPDIPMADAPEPNAGEIARAIAVARLFLGGDMNVQAPPNLSPHDHRLLLRAGINDWGGISPVTPDHVNPEAPWPQIIALAATCRVEGFVLRERLDDLSRVRAPAVSRSRVDLARRSPREGHPHGGRPCRRRSLKSFAPACRSTAASPPRLRSFAPCSSDRSLAMSSTSTTGSPVSPPKPTIFALIAVADAIRMTDVGDDVTYVVNRNINFTNVCFVGCRFCAFKRQRWEADAYNVGVDEVLARVQEAVDRGATEICMQGGINPDMPPFTYRDILVAIKTRLPAHPHARLLADGDHVRHAAHRHELPRLPRDAEGRRPRHHPRHRRRDPRRRRPRDPEPQEGRRAHLGRDHHHGARARHPQHLDGDVRPRRERPSTSLRTSRSSALDQQETGGFTEFVPLRFIHTNTELFRDGLVREPPPKGWFDLRIYAFSRLMLRGWIDNLQTSWVKLNHELAQLSLQAGCNDFGGTLMEESISREAGADAGEYTPVEEIRRLIGEIGRRPVERNTVYGKIEDGEESEAGAGTTGADGAGRRSRSREVSAWPGPYC